MNREERLKLITSLISEQQVTNQTQLVDLLSKQGYSVTQATLSRDIRDLGIAKIHRDGKSYYVILNSGDNQPRFQAIYRQFVLSVSSVMFMVVAHTRLGEADLLANEFDTAHRPEILGTVAGADTLLIVCASVQFADKLFTEINEALQ